MAEASGGRIHFDWNQVRGDTGGGARTGRLSSSPNVQNIPKELSTAAPAGLPDLPLLRTYLLPEEGHVWVRLDFSQQELRLLAHFAEGSLAQMYRDDPNIDVHQKVADTMGIERRPAKTMAFALLYGMGLAELSIRLGCDVARAKELRDEYLRLLPGISAVNAQLKARAKANEPYTTWGGRQYYCEPPRIVEGRLRTFEYKCINYLIQSSAADMTKEAMARLFEASLPGRFLACVHDEINWSVPKGSLAKTTKALHSIMTSVQLDVPVMSDVEAGPSWGEVKKYAF
jgi:DNA polymerase I-like protein with 3'-5' exonuclease and polymerase domains